MKIFQTKIFLYCICFVSAWFAVNITMGLQSQSIYFTAITKQNPVSKENLTKNKQYQKILQTNLFHGLVYNPNKTINHTEKNTPQSDSGSIPVSSQPIKLWGTIILNNPSENKAIIGNGKEQKIYNVNQNINGWKIIEINREEIIIAQNSKKEKLILRNKDNITQADFSYSLSKRELVSLFNDVPLILQHIQLTPYNNGGIRGLQIMNIVPGTYFDNLSLMPQDILLQINDTVISSYNDMARLTALAKENEFHLSVLRSGKKLTIKYTLK